MRLIDFKESIIDQQEGGGLETPGWYVKLIAHLDWIERVFGGSA